MTVSRHRWTPDEDAHLRAHYAGRLTPDLAREMGMSTRAVHLRARRLGLRKSAALRTAIGRMAVGHPRVLAARFQPGSEPWNKGLTGFDAGGRSHETRFARGARNGVAASRWVPVGTVRIAKDGYLEIKVADEVRGVKRNWTLVHRVVWEQAHGPIPAGYAITFADGDRRNVALENLRLTPRADLMARNTVHRLPHELECIIRKLDRMRRIIRAQEDR